MTRKDIMLQNLFYKINTFFVTLLWTYWCTCIIYTITWVRWHEDNWHNWLISLLSFYTAYSTDKGQRIDQSDCYNENIINSNNTKNNNNLYKIYFDCIVKNTLSEQIHYLILSLMINSDGQYMHYLFQMKNARILKEILYSKLRRNKNKKWLKEKIQESTQGVHLWNFCIWLANMEKTLQS